MFWSWQQFFHELANLGFAGAAWTTLWTASVIEAAAVVGGFGLALSSRSRFPAARVAVGLYVWVWRGTPLLVQLLIVYFGLPQFGIRLGVLGSGLLTFVLNESAYMSVLASAALQEVPVGQYEASKMLGLSPWTRFHQVIFPQAFRTFIPVLGNQFNYMLKTTSLLSVISLVELTRFSEVELNATYQPSEVFAVAALYYLALTILWGGVQRLLDTKFGNLQTARRRTPRSAKLRQLHEAITEAAS